VIRSLRTRLFLGLAALLVVTCVGAGFWALDWSFDEAVELQDAILLQVGTLALQNHVEGELPAQAGVDAEATIIIRDIPNKPVPAAKGIGFAIPLDLTDGLHTLDGRDGSWRVLLRTRSDGSRVAVAQPTAARDEFARDSAIRAVVIFGQCQELFEQADRAPNAGFERNKTAVGLFGKLRIVYVPEGDGTALNIMVRNLVDNAVRYSPNGGHVNLSVYRDDDRVVLLIEDTGPGIAAGDLDIIFEPFNRGSLPSGDGTGLGLSIARRIVDNHGGSIRLENIIASNTTGLRVELRLPTAPYDPRQGP
jgi:hypothetical protein